MVVEVVLEWGFMVIVRVGCGLIIGGVDVVFLVVWGLKCILFAQVDQNLFKNIYAKGTLCRKVDIPNLLNHSKVNYMVQDLF